MTIHPFAPVAAALRRARLKRQRRALCRERERLAEMRRTSAEVIAAQVAYIAYLEGRFLETLRRDCGTTTGEIAAAAERDAKGALLS